MVSQSEKAEPKKLKELPDRGKQPSLPDSEADIGKKLPLPSAPTVFRYMDDFSNTKKSISFENVSWKFRVDGRNATINWKDYSDDELEILKRYFVWCVSEYDASTVLHYANMLKPNKLFVKAVVQAFSHTVVEAKEIWETSLGVECAIHLAGLARSFASFLCSQSLYYWNADDTEYVKSWNWFGNNVKNSHSDEFSEFRLSSKDERHLIAYIQSVAQRCKKTSDSRVAKDAQRAALLYWVYQHAFRPTQIASLDLGDVNIRYGQNGRTKSVHATFHKAKQRTARKRTPMPRKMKSEWVSIMEIVMKHRVSSRKVFERESSFFGMTPPEASQEIRDLTFEVVGSYISATDLRHNAAQRLADSGASHLQLA